MEKIFTIAICYISTLAIAKPIAHGIPQGPKAVEEWFKNLPSAKEKLTKLHFYFHDTVTGKKPTAITVAQTNSTLTFPTSFGQIRMTDDPLTVGPGPSSKIVGRAQGMYSSVSFQEAGYLMTLNFVFTYGDYNGSTLSMVGHNPIMHKYREMPIVGGSGVFRLARGIATAKTVWVNLTTQNAVVEYNVMVLYYI